MYDFEYMARTDVEMLLRSFSATPYSSILNLFFSTAGEAQELKLLVSSTVSAWIPVLPQYTLTPCVNNVTSADVIEMGKLISNTADVKDGYSIVFGAVECLK